MASIVNRLFHLRRWQKNPHLAPGLVTEQPKDFTADDEMMLRTGIVKDVSAGRRLLAKSGRLTAAEYVLKDLKPLPKFADFRARLASIVRAIEGSYPYEPTIGPAYKRLKRGARDW